MYEQHRNEKPEDTNMSIMTSMENIRKSPKKLFSAMEKEIETIVNNDLVNVNQNLKQNLHQT